MTTKAVKKVLSDAADYIEEHGWTRTGAEKDGRVCVGVAINRVSPSLALGRRARDVLGAHVGTAFITSWNDREARSRQHVIATLRELAS